MNNILGPRGEARGGDGSAVTMVVSESDPYIAITVVEVGEIAAGDVLAFALSGMEDFPFENNNLERLVEVTSPEAIS